MGFGSKKIFISLIITISAVIALILIYNPIMAKITLAKSTKNIVFSLPARDKFFITKDIGWKASYDAQGMMKEDMILYKTINGGKSWVLIADTNKLKTIPLEGNKTGMSFISKTKGWIAANAPWEGKIGLSTTDNGGLTWHYQKLPIPAVFKHSEIISYPPIILSSLDGLLVTFPFINDVKHHVLIYATHDGGKTWLPFADKTKGSSIGITWNIINAAQRTLSVSYKNNSWSFDGENWIK